MRSDRDERWERVKKKISFRFPDTMPLGPQPAERLSLAVPCDCTGFLSSIGFGVSLWDTPLSHIPQKSYYITPAPIGWQT